jgi:hypothetical protein
MKLSTINWLSRAIALPLFATIFQILPASAEPSHRAPRIALEASNPSPLEFLPAPTDLNLRLPIPVTTIVPDDREPSNSIEPIWANPDRHQSVKPVIKRTLSPRASLKRRDRSSVHLKPVTSLIKDRANHPKSGSNRRNLIARNLDIRLPTVADDNSQPKYTPKPRIAAISSPPFSGNYLKLVRDPSKGNNNVGNPIYTLEAYLNGRKYQTFAVVSGTKNSQSLDRNLGNNSAPLPDGLYDVSNRIIAGNTPEVGKTFISIFPKFETGRNSLGIHLDRSFNKDNGYDGTAGCIGITTSVDRDAINEFVTRYHPRNLVVTIASAPN